MLYIFYGNEKKSVDKAIALVNSLKVKKPDASYVEFDGDSWKKEIVDEHAGGQGLFSNKYIIFLNRVAKNKESEEELAKTLQLMKESDNIFILSLGEVGTSLSKALEKFADKLVKTEIEAVVRKTEFNIFSLADAVGGREKLRSWSIYRQAIINGLEPESIVGTIFWQIKSIILSKDAKSATETGLNPFVFSKSKKYSHLYSDLELKKMLKNLIVVYHNAHRGLVDLEMGVEKMVLEN
jgi:DNA polymerase III delta subunit